LDRRTLFSPEAIESPLLSRPAAARLSPPEDEPRSYDDEHSELLSSSFVEGGLKSACSKDSMVNPVKQQDVGWAEKSEVGRNPFPTKEKAHLPDWAQVTPKGMKGVSIAT
jgi:hypothetical protein